MSRSPAAPAAVAMSALVAVLALSGCSADGGVAGPYAPAAPAYGTTPDGPASLTPPDRTILTSNSTAQLGTVVIDGLGWTLYRFDEDSADPSTATCVDDCASTWPPVLLTGSDEPVLEGVDADLVGSVERADGSSQVTVGGWPVYRYAQDSAPGATDGHGTDEAWFAVTPTGQRAEAP